MASAGGRLFTSYERSDATDLDYAINRTYDPNQGRFMQVDPLEMQTVSPGNPQTINMYTNVKNDPINSTDMLGLVESVLKPNSQGCGMSFRVFR